VGTIKTSQGFVVACVLNALRIIYLMTCFISESFHTHEQLTSSSRAAHGVSSNGSIIRFSCRV